MKVVSLDCKTGAAIRYVFDEVMIHPTHEAVFEPPGASVAPAMLQEFVCAPPPDFKTKTLQPFMRSGVRTGRVRPYRPGGNSAA